MFDSIGKSKWHRLVSQLFGSRGEIVATNFCGYTRDAITSLVKRKLNCIFLHSFSVFHSEWFLELKEIWYGMVLSVFVWDDIVFEDTPCLSTLIWLISNRVSRLIVDMSVVCIEQFHGISWQQLEYLLHSN